LQTDEIIAKLSLKCDETLIFDMLQQLITNLKIKILSLNIIKKLSLKMSKLMKLSKNYSFKKSKSNEIFSFKFPFIDNRYQKMTRRVGDSPSRRVNDSPTQRVDDSPTRGVAERKNKHQNVFSHTMVVFSPLKFMKKDDFLSKNVR
jgi:hypothetical protein